MSIEDVHAFMEVLHSLPPPALDLVLHSSGGSPTAAEAIINYVRQKFPDLRVIVPLAAMSAATIMTCGADRVLMGKHSYLGPIDPQLVLQTPLGVQAVPAYAIREQFTRAQKEAANPALFPAWIPMLQQYGPGLLVQCDNVIALSEELVRKWLERWMFAREPDSAQRARAAAQALNDHAAHKAHGRFLTRDDVKGFGLVVDDLEADQDLQDAVLTVFHSFMHTFSMNPGVTKIVENNLGKSFIKLSGLKIGGPPPAPPPPDEPPAP